MRAQAGDDEREQQQYGPVGLRETMTPFKERQ
jgi:hypothetical protein